MVRHVFDLIILAYLANAASISNFKEHLKCLTNWNTNAEQGRYFEGDMILTTAQMDAIIFGNTKRNGVRNTIFLWPNATVVYHLEGYYDETQLEMIKEAMNEISSKSCIKFRPRENYEHAVIIQNTDPGCFSCVGFRKVADVECEKQQLNLEKNCFQHGIIVHELLHTIGFYHMQSSYDRDDYVKILWENINSDSQYNFLKYPKNIVTNFGVPYDYNSIMHYGSCDFTKNGKRTIIPLQDHVTIGQREGLSIGDILKLNRMYNCYQA